MRVILVRCRGEAGKSICTVGFARSHDHGLGGGTQGRCNPRCVERGIPAVIVRNQRKLNAGHIRRDRPHACRLRTSGAHWIDQQDLHTTIAHRRARDRLWMAIAPTLPEAALHARRPRMPGPDRRTGQRCSQALSWRPCSRRVPARPDQAAHPAATQARSLVPAPSAAASTLRHQRSRRRARCWSVRHGERRSARFRPSSGTVIAVATRRRSAPPSMAGSGTAPAITDRSAPSPNRWPPPCRPGWSWSV